MEAGSDARREIRERRGADCAKKARDRVVWSLSSRGRAGVNRHAQENAQLDKVVDRFGQAWRER
jgi:hypothetical protein